MQQNIIDTIKNYFSADFVNRAAANLSESHSGVSNALSAIIPTGLAGILHKATSGPEGENTVFNTATAAEAALSSSPSVTTPASAGINLPGLFGGNESGVASAIAGFAGTKNDTVSSLLKMAIPAILGLLGRHAKENRLSANGLAGFLSSQKGNIMSAMPAGLSSLTGMLGLGNFSAAASSPVPPKVNVERHTQEVFASDGGGGGKWILPVIIGIVAIGLLWYFLKGCNKEEPVSSTTPAVITSTDTATTVTAAATPVATTPESIKVKLPNGKELDAYRGGIEDQLVTFLGGNWKAMSDDALKEKWFNFDNLNFNTGNATLLPESEKQLANIADILKAFPDVKIKIGGYTDASGEPMSNKKLSQDRADAAKAGLEKLGVGKQVMGAEGYGSEFAKFPASASEEERALDRHVSVSVRK